MQSRLESGVDALRLKLTIAQLHLSHEHIFKACDTLRSITSHCHLPGLVSI